MPAGSLAKALVAPRLNNARKKARSLLRFQRATMRVPIPVTPEAERVKVRSARVRIVFMRVAYESGRRHLSETCKRVAKEVAGVPSAEGLSAFERLHSYFFDAGLASTTNTAFKSLFGTATK